MALASAKRHRVTGGFLRNRQPGAMEGAMQLVLVTIMDMVVCLSGSRERDRIGLRVKSIGT